MKLFFGLFSIFLILGCITTEYNVGTQRQDIILYSSEKEVSLGQNIAKEIASKFKFSQNPQDIERVKKIGEKILEVCDRREINYYFYVIEENERKEREKNAFSLPGGYIYIYKDLLDILDDNELAFVLAHEIAHIVCRHVVKKLQAVMGYNLLILASVGITKDAQFTKGLSFALAQVMSAYSQEDEFMADKLAVKYLQLLDYEPTVSINVLEKLYKENKKEIHPISYFRTHPYTAQRIRNIKETLKLPLSPEDYLN